MLFIYLFYPNLTVRTRRAARDGSLTARATGRHSHILFSLLAVLSCATLTPPMPHHSRNSSTITSISISVHIKSTHSLSIPAIFLFHFTSFGKTTYCIYPPYITALSSSPSPGTLTKLPPGTPTSPKSGFGTRPFYPDRPVLSLQSSLLGLHKGTCQTVGIPPNEPYCLR